MVLMLKGYKTFDKQYLIIFPPISRCWGRLARYGRLNFRKISYGEAGNLIKPFSLEEVKQTVWDCDGFKSPKQDDISFDFIKKIGIY